MGINHLPILSLLYSPLPDKSSIRHLKILKKKKKEEAKRNAVKCVFYSPLSKSFPCVPKRVPLRGSFCGFGSPFSKLPFFLNSTLKRKIIAVKVPILCKQFKLLKYVGLYILKGRSCVWKYALIQFLDIKTICNFRVPFLTWARSPFCSKSDKFEFFFVTIWHGRGVKNTPILLKLWIMHHTNKVPIPKNWKHCCDCSIFSVSAARPGDVMILRWSDGKDVAISGFNPPGECTSNFWGLGWTSIED